jgi:hypothetical protein
MWMLVGLWGMDSLGSQKRMVAPGKYYGDTAPIQLQGDSLIPVMLTEVPPYVGPPIKVS